MSKKSHLEVFISASIGSLGISTCEDIFEVILKLLLVLSLK